MVKKNTFLGYYDWINYANAMNDEQLGILFRKILQHVNQEEEDELPLELKIVRADIQTKLDVNAEKRNNKVEETRKKRSEAGSNHLGNQYTRQGEKRYPQKQAKKTSMEQMEQMEQNGTNGTNGTCLIHNIYNSLSSSKKEEKNIRKEEREKMLEAFRKDDRLIRFMDEDDVLRWWDFKEGTKKPYKDFSSYITALVKFKNIIKDYGGMPKSDRNRRNRFNFAVNEAIEKEREGLHWYDYMEPIYESSKSDLYPNPKQNE